MTKICFLVLFLMDAITEAQVATQYESTPLPPLFWGMAAQRAEESSSKTEKLSLRSALQQKKSIDYAVQELAQVSRKVQHERGQINRNYEYARFLNDQVWDFTKTYIDPLTKRIPSPFVKLVPFGISAARTTTNLFLQEYRDRNLAYVGTMYQDFIQKIPVNIRLNREAVDRYLAENGDALMADKVTSVLFGADKDLTQVKAGIKIISDRIAQFMMKSDQERENLRRRTAQDSQALRRKMVTQEIEVQQSFERLSLQQRKMMVPLNELNRSLEQIEKDQRATRSDVAMIKNIVFAGQPPSVQLDAIRRGSLSLAFSDDQDGKKRANAIRVLELRKAIEEDAGNVLNKVSQAARLARAVGVDPQLVDQVQRGVDYAATIGSAALKFGTHDYLGGAVAVAGLLTGPTPDPEEIRFNALAGMLDRVLQNQKKMIEALNRIERNTESILAKLDIIDFHLQSQSNMLNELLKRQMNLKSCELFETNHQGVSFNSFAEFVQHFQEKNEVPYAGIKQEGRLRSCLRGISEFFQITQSDPISTFLLLSSKDHRDTDGVLSYFDILNFLSLSWEKYLASDPDSDLYSLLVSRPITPLEILKLTSPTTKASHDDGSLLGSLISSRTLLTYTNYLLSNHVYGFLIMRKDGQDVLLDPRIQSLSPAVTRHLLSQKIRIVNDLKNALRLVDLAIAQQNLLTGGVNLEFIDRALVAPKGGSKSEEENAEIEKMRNAAQRLLGVNQTFYSNWVKYFTYKRLLATEKKFEFARASDLQEIDTIRQVLAPIPEGSQIEYEKTAQGMALVMKTRAWTHHTGSYQDFKEVLPSVQQLDSRAQKKNPDFFELSTDMKALMAARNRLTDTILNYTALDNLTPSERIQFLSHYYLR